MFKKIIAVLILIAAVFSLFSCSEGYFGHAELRIPLEENFKKQKTSDFDVAYSNGEAAVAILRISFVAGYDIGIPQTLMPNEFAAYYLYRTDRTEKINRMDDFAFYEYTEEYESGKYYHLMSFFRSEYAYFAVLYSTPEALKEKWRDKFIEYSDEVYFVKYNSRT